MTIGRVSGLGVRRSATSEAMRPTARNVRVKFESTNWIASPIAVPRSPRSAPVPVKPPAHADAHGGERAFAAALFQAMHGGEREPGAGHAERMTKRDRAAMRIDVLGVVGDAKLPQKASPCEAKASFNSIRSKSPIFSRGAPSICASTVRGRCPRPRRDRGRRHAEHARPRRRRAPSRHPRWRE